MNPQIQNLIDSIARVSSASNFITNVMNNQTIKQNWATLSQNQAFMNYLLRVGSNLGGGGGGGNPLDKGKSIIKESMGGFVDLLSSQEQLYYMPGMDTEMFDVKDVTSNIEKIYGILKDKNLSGVNKIKELLIGAAGAINGQIVLYLQQQSALMTIINKQAGLTGDYARDFRQGLTEANPRLLQLGVGFQDLALAAKDAVDQSFKFAALNKETWERAGEVAIAYVGTLSQLVAMYPEFAKVGLGASDAQERIAKAGKDAISVGLQAQKVTKDISANLSYINAYGFKNGIDGLSAMVRKSIEFRTSMESVFSIAEKVMNPEGAIELSANLQVLGGAIGDFNDPLKLMYMATNNVEGLQDALIGAASSLATYNEKQGRFEITGVNLRKASEMAKALNINMKDLTTSAIASAERTAATTALLARGLTIDDKQREFLTNIAQMKGGKMVIELGASPELKKQFGKSEVAIEELTNSQVETIMKYQKDLEKLSEEEIIRQQASDIHNIKLDINSMLARGRNIAGSLAAEGFKRTLSGPAETTKEMAKNFNKEYQGYEEKIKEKFKEFIEETINPVIKVATQTFQPLIDIINNIKLDFEKPSASASSPAPSLSTAPVTPSVPPDVTMAYQDKMTTTSQATADNTALMAKNLNLPQQNTPVVKLNNDDIKAIASTSAPNKKETPVFTKPIQEEPKDYAINTSTNKILENLNGTISSIPNRLQYDYSKISDLKSEKNKTFEPIEINIRKETDDTRYMAMVSGKLNDVQNNLLALYKNEKQANEPTKTTQEKPTEIVKTLKIEISTPDVIFDGMKTKLLTDNVFINDLKQIIKNEKDFLSIPYTGVKI